MPQTRIGPTPAGGDRSVALFLDGEGREVYTPERAATMKVTEYAGPHVLRRTYLDRDPGAGPGAAEPLTTVDDPIATADTAHSWDIWVVDDGQWRLAATKDDLLQALEIDGHPLDEQRRAVGEFMTNPCWEAAPEHLVTEVGAWLVGTRPPQQPKA